MPPLALTTTRFAAGGRVDIGVSCFAMTRYAPLFLIVASSLAACGTDTPADNDVDESCAEGSFRSTTGACQAWMQCAPGSRVTGEPSATADRTCTGCASGTYNTQPNSAACADWGECPSGTFVSNTPSATQDRTCSPCPEGTSTAGFNFSVCVEDETCVPGTALQGHVCVACPAGNYCAGGATVAVACAVGTWDHDADAATICAEQTTCVAGEVITVVGTTTTDRGCAPCPPSEFSVAPNSESCTPRLVCEDGTVAENTPSSSACNVCDGGTWDDDGDPETACVAQAVCEPGEFVSVVGEPAVAQVCEPCAAETFSDASNASACVAWTTCEAPGDYVTSAPSAVLDRGCTPCPDVTINGNTLSTYAIEDNAEECCDYPDPADATIVVNPGTGSEETVAFGCTNVDGCPLSNPNPALRAHTFVASSNSSDAQCASQYSYSWMVRYSTNLEGGAQWTSRGIQGSTTDTLTILPYSLPDAGTVRYRVRLTIVNVTTGVALERRFRFQYADSTVSIPYARQCQSSTPPADCPENILPPL